MAVICSFCDEFIKILCKAVQIACLKIDKPQIYSVLLSKQ
jgi:hypothetical protein